MDPIIDLAPGAEDNPLAVRLADLIRGNLASHPGRTRDFRAIRGAVQIVAEDTGDALTMRFDLGRLTIHDGSIGIPSVTLCAPADTLLELPDAPIAPRPHLPGGTREAGPQSVAGLLASGALKVYGLASHPRLVFRLIRLLSRRV